MPRGGRGALAAVGALAILVAIAANPAIAKRKKDVRFAPRGTVVSRSLFAWDIAAQADGRIVTVGRSGGRRTRAVVARRLDDGQLDPSFHSGVVPVAAKAATYLIAIQPDGRILIAGEAPGTGMSADGSPSDFILARLLSSGQLDPSFGSGGVVRTDFGADDTPSALTLQHDGKIILAGGADRGYPDRANPDSSFALARYEPDGSLDPSFGAGGKALISFGQFNDARAVAVEPDGRIAVAGSNQVDPGSNEPVKLAQARLLPNGSLDPSFGSGGRIVTPFLTPDEDFNLFIDPFPISALTYTADGRLVVVGVGSVRRKKRVIDGTKVERMTVDGVPDPSFGVQGTTFLGPRKMGIPYGVGVAPDGKIVVSGDGGGFRDGVQVTRLQPNGALDPSFGRTGSVITALPGGVEEFPAVAFDGLGRVLVAGQSDIHGELRSIMARYQPSGRLDKTFGLRHKRRHPKHRHHR